MKQQSKWSFFVRNNKGTSMIEALVASAVLATSALSVAYIYDTQSKLDNQAQLQKAVLQVKKQLLETVKDYQSWSKTFSHVDNASMACLRSGSDCFGQKGAISIYNLKDTKIAGQEGTWGWDKNAVACSLLSPAEDYSANSKSCLFRFNVTWEAVCSASPCVNPLVKLNFQFAGNENTKLNSAKYSFEVLQSSENEKQVMACDMFKGAYQNGVCDIPLFTPCPTGTYLNGFFESKPICKPLPAVACPAGKFLASIKNKKVEVLDLEGKSNTEDRMVASCVSPQPPPPFALGGSVEVGCRGRVDGASCQNFYYARTETNQLGINEDIYECVGGHTHKCGGHRWVGYKMTVRVPATCTEAMTIDVAGKKQLVAPLTCATYDCEGSTGWAAKSKCLLNGPIKAEWPKPPPPPPFQAIATISIGRNSYDASSSSFYLVKTEGGQDIFEAEASYYVNRSSRVVKLIVKVPEGTATTSEEPNPYKRNESRIRLGKPSTGTLECIAPPDPNPRNRVTPTCIMRAFR
ncbi:MAG: hypothetical protein ACOYOK_11215 [Pseudobdellovibrionaceae bacterium]